jgi:hypothetical protein
MSDLSTEAEIFAAATATEEAVTAPTTTEPSGQQASRDQGQTEDQPSGQPVQEQQPGTENRQSGGDLTVALRQERENLKALRAELDRERNERSQLMQMLRGVQGRQEPQQQPEPEQDPLDAFLTDPRAATQKLVQPLLQGAQQQLMAMAHQVAELRHTPEVVTEAEQAFLAAMNAGTLDQADYQRVANAPNRWDAAVQWHKRHSMLSAIGDDPAAYERQLREKILAELQGSANQPAQAAGAQPAPNLPSLNRAIGNAGAPQSGSITDDDIFNSAPAFGRRKG